MLCDDSNLLLNILFLQRPTFYRGQYSSREKNNLVWSEINLINTGPCCVSCVLTDILFYKLTEQSVDSHLTLEWRCNCLSDV